ncbi:hypothetical protein Tco_0169661 [Tanacetum coccineum]
MVRRFNRHYPNGTRHSDCQYLYENVDRVEFTSNILELGSLEQEGNHVEDNRQLGSPELEVLVVKGSRTIVVVRIRH